MARPDRSKSQHAGRITLAPCEVLGGDRHCEPLNRVWILRPEGNVERAYASCSCGRRFRSGRRPSLAEDLERWRSSLNGHSLIDEASARSIVEQLWPAGRKSRFARTGIVPVGTPVLHSPTDFLTRTDGPEVAALESRCLASMATAQGIGLAANQVGAPLRMLAHNLGRVAPQVLVNPVLLDSSGVWTYEEGCLSLHVNNTRSRVDRPKQIDVIAGLPSGGVIILEADELLSRVLQHELDHLEGIEYVQRLTGSRRDRVYEAMANAGVDVSWLPFRPYGHSADSSWLCGQA